MSKVHLWLSDGLPSGGGCLLQAFGMLPPQFVASSAEVSMYERPCSQMR